MRSSNKINSKVGKFSKVVLGVLVAAVAIVPSFACGVSAKAASVEETSKIVGMKLNKCFPDSTFARYVYEEVLGRSNWDNKGSNYRIKEADAEVIGSCKKIDVSYKLCTSLYGIQYFTQLNELDCSHNLLDSLNVSDCCHLSKLCCSDNKIHCLNFNGCPLMHLDCARNPIEGALKFSLYTNNLNHLDYLDCSGTNIREIRIFSQPFINEIKASECNDLEEVHVDGCNNLRAVNLSNCSSLDIVSIHGCEWLESVNVSNCSNLSLLHLQKNVEMDVDTNGCENIKCFTGLD